MKIASLEYCLGSHMETWDELLKDNPDWDKESLTSKTGVSIRYVSGSDETALTLAVAASVELLTKNGKDAINGLIYVTQSPDSHIPATACLLHQELGLPSNCFAFDLNQGCSGFIYGLSIASSMLASCELQQILLVCSETYRKYIDIHDRTCRPIFSDGASAVIIRSEDKGSLGPFTFLTDGSGAPNLTLKDPQNHNDLPRLFMNGPSVLMFTMAAVPKATNTLLEMASLKIDDIDLFIFHQASAVVLDNIQRALDIPDARFYRHVQFVGNTVSSTIPIALKHALDEGVVNEGATLLLMGFGVGYSLAGCIVRT